MSVAFNRTPTNLRVPFFYAEVNAGPNYYEGNSRLLLVGQMLQGQAAQTPVDGNTGDGHLVFDTPAVLAGAALGVYRVIFTSATSFIVRNPNNAIIGGGTVGTDFSKQVSFTAVAGTTAFDVDDEIDITVKRLKPQADPNVPVIIQHMPSDLFGAGSMLTDMWAVARRANPSGEIWALPLLDPPGVAATATITVTPPGIDGTLVLYVCGQKLQVEILATDTARTIGNEIALAINAGYTTTDGVALQFPMFAGTNQTTGVVTVKANHVGALGNFLSIDRHLVGDEGPLANYISIVNFGASSGVTRGSGVPSLSEGLAALGDQEFDYIAGPYADTTSLDTMRDFLSDVGGRWDPLQQIYGHYLTANFANLAGQSTLGGGRNDPHTSIMAVATSPSPPWIWAASLGGIVQLHKNLGADIGDAGEISRPLQTLLLPGVRPRKPGFDAWDISERQVLYYDGLSAFVVGRDGQVYIDRLTTTYQTNAFGQPDATFLDIETIAQCVYAIRFMRQYLTSKHPRDALVDDNPHALQGFTTVQDLKADVIHAYKQLVAGGVMKNADLFAQNVIVEQAGDPNRVNAYLPLDVVNQLRVFAANATTFLNAATEAA